MTTVDWIIFIFIALAVFAGITSGFDGQIKRLGKGIKGIIIAGAIVFMWGSYIFNWSPIVSMFDNLSGFFIDRDLKFLSEGFMFDIIKYLLLFLFVLILTKIVFELLGSFVTGNEGQGTVNKLLGGLFAGAIATIFVLLSFVVIVVINNTDALNAIKGSISQVFLYNNPFMSVFGLSV